MQSSPINAAQLMMEFLEKEQTDIGQGIVATEFSRELEKQKLQIDGAPSPTSPASLKGNLSGETTSPSLSATLEPVLSGSAKDNVATQRSKSLKRLVSDGKPASDSRSKIQEEMFFSNPALLEKVLADLKLPAEVRKACTSAEDKQGRLSLGNLLNVLDKQTAGSSTLTPGKASGQDVEALLKSLALPGSRDTLATQELVTRPRGVYGLNELRQVLEKAVRQVQEAKALRTAVTDETGRQAVHLAELKTGASDTRSSSTPTQSAPLMASSVPSFVGGNFREKDPSRTTERPPSVLDLQGISSSINEKDGSVSGAHQAKASEGQNGMSLSRLETGTRESRSVYSSNIKSSDGTALLANLSEAAREILDRAHPAEGSGLESLAGNAKIPKEHLTDARVISMGQSLSQDVQDTLKSILQDGPGLMASGKQWATARETSTYNGTIPEHGATELQGQPQPGTLSQPPISLVNPSDAKTSSGYEENAGREDRQEHFKGEAARKNTSGSSSADPSVPAPKITPGSSRVDGFPTGQSAGAQNLKADSHEDTAGQGSGRRLDPTTNFAGAKEIPSTSREAPRAQMTDPPSRLDNVLARAQEGPGVWGQATTPIQEEAAPVREKLSRAVSSQFDPLVDGETRRTDPQPLQGASDSGLGHTQTDGGGSDSHVFDSWGRAFMGYSPVSQGMPVNEPFQTPFRGESLSLVNPAWPQNMAQHIQNLLKERPTSHLTLELEPSELGRLTLRVETKHEEVTASVIAEKEQAREVLLRNAPALRQNLQEQGLTLGQFLVDVRDERSGSGQHPMPNRAFSKKPSRGQAELKSQRVQGDTGIVRIHANPNHLINILA